MMTPSNNPPAQTASSRQGSPDLQNSRPGLSRRPRKMPSSFTRESSRKEKPRPRKALASLLGWGRSGSPHSEPARPRPEDRPVSAASVRHDEPRPTTASKPIRSGWSVRTASSTTTDHPIPENKVRPSCPPDPFQRTQGARIIPRPFPDSRAANAKTLRSERHTATVPAPSPQHNNDCSGGHLVADESWVEGLSNFEAPPPLSLPSLCPNQLSGQPIFEPKDRASRFGSLGRTLESIREPAKVNEPLSRSHLILRKEKTKSRVRGMFTGKLKKPPREVVAQNDVATRRSPIPIVRITKPSNDTLPPSPPGIQATPSFSPYSAFTQNSEGNLSSKHLPRRKSLTGLFGIDLKRSASRLRSPFRSPERSPNRNVKPQASPVSPKRWTPKRGTPRKAALTTIARSSVFDRTANDASPDTAAFYSRFGNSGFNPEGTLCHSDVTIRDTNSATTQLARFLASIDSLGSPTPLRKMRSAVFPIVPLSKIPMQGATSTNSSPGCIRGKVKAPKSPLKSALRTPVSTFKKGVRSLVSPLSPSPPSPTPQRIAPPSLQASEISISVAEQIDSVSDNGDIVIHISPPGESHAIASSSDVLDVPRDLRHSLTSSVATPPTVSWRPPSHLPPAPPADRKIDRLAERKLHTTHAGASPTLLVAPSVEDERGSFDFTHEVLSLERGDGRTSFIRALHRALSSEAIASPLKQFSPPHNHHNETLVAPAISSSRSTAPFEGQAAFQKFVAQTKSNAKSAKSIPAASHPPPFALPPLPQIPLVHVEHSRHESAMSFASTSSLGAPLESAPSSRSSHFETTYAPRLPPLPSMSRYSTVPYAIIAARNHQHERTASSSSVDSSSGAQISYVSGSMRRAGRPSFYTSHSRKASTESTIGRSDWHSHRRASSSASSVLSMARLGRPALSERMFDRDEDVMLSSFHPREDSWSHASSYSYEASYENGSMEARNDSMFSPSEHHADRSFLIMGRPISGMSSDESDAPDDTFSGKSKALEKVLQEVKNNVPPTVRARHRPPPLTLYESGLSTPGLISPDATADTSADDSSLFSLETRFSNPPLSAVLGNHSRHPSLTASVMKIEPTIHEERSQSTIRSSRPLASPAPIERNIGVDGSSVTASWFQWQREAEDVVQQNQQTWLNSPASDEAVIDVPQFTTHSDIEAFLAASKAKYKSLDQLPLGHVVERRRTHLSDSRASAAPYCLQIPPLESRFRNKRSSSSSADYENAPVSALLAEFARDQLPVVVPVTQLASKASAADTLAEPNRQSVTHSARRKNLGWARRRPGSQDGAISKLSPSRLPRSTSTAATDDAQPQGDVDSQPQLEKRPSFLCFSPTIEPESVFGSSKIVRPPPLRRRHVSGKVTTFGSPLNLNGDLNPQSLAERQGRDSWEPGSSPLAMRALHSTPPAEESKTRRSTRARTVERPRPHASVPSSQLQGIGASASVKSSRPPASNITRLLPGPAASKIQTGQSNRSALSHKPVAGQKAATTDENTRVDNPRKQLSDKYVAQRHAPRPKKQAQVIRA